MHHLRALIPACAAILLVAAGSPEPATEGPPTAEQVRFFESKVRPVLVENCAKCHGEKKQRGGLRLDSREALLAGGESGPAIVPGKPDESLLIEAIHYESLEMPPKGKLPDQQAAALVDWVKMGAPWPADGKKVRPVAGRGPRFSDEDRSWWAFQPVRDPKVPQDAGDGWSKNPIDRFVAHRLKAEGLAPAPEADRIALIRRVSFDVTGLPPTPGEIDAFFADRSPEAYERLVDRLLASPRYGERWARHWLDLVRYADSDGYRLDQYRPYAWLYRDYIVRSLNEDKPYDRLVLEQLAGDELFPGDPQALIATGYLRHGIYEYNSRDVRGQWDIILNDITDTTADVFLGLGLQCARCHDHKFDPILQKDYYRLRAFFAPILPHDNVVAATADEVAKYEARRSAWEAKTADLRRQIEEIESRYRAIASNDAIEKFPLEIKEMIRKPVAARQPLEHQLAELGYRQVDYEFSRLDARLKGQDKERVLALRKQLAAFDRDRPEPLPTPLIATDVGPEAPPVFIPKKAAVPVEPGFPTILEEGPAAIETLAGAPRSTGRRAALARWLTRPDNPLSTRVIVNRLWQYHLGRGLAANASDFGRLGEAPTHPELLDWLTTRFVREGWRLKSLHRLILTSATYRQAATNPLAATCQTRDPENRLYWRGSTRRLEAEQVRDAVLAVTGELDPTAGGPGVNSTDPRRSIYTRSLRNIRDPLLDVFDLPLFFSSTPTRDTTTTPLQSLLLINSQAMTLHARAFADRLEREGVVAEEDAVVAAYRLAFGRSPDADETAAALQFLREQRRRIDPTEAGGAEAAFLHDKLPYRDGQAAVLSPKGPQVRFEVPHRDQLPRGDFTIEAFFLLHSVYDTGSVRTIAAEWDGDMTHPGWSFGVTGRGSRRKPQTLVLQLLGTKQGGDFGEAAIFSDQHVALEKPYYAAASVSLAGDGPGSVTFFLKDLSNDDEPLLTAKVSHAVTGGFRNDLPLTLGALGGTKRGLFDGLIDDVRLSSGALGIDQILYTAEGVGRGTLGYWRFEPDPGVFRDATGHGLEIRPAPSASKSGMDARRAALVDFCHVLLNSNEFLYVN